MNQREMHDVKEQQYNDRLGEKGKNNRASTTSETRKMKEQQLAKGIKRPVNDANLILAASNNNQQAEDQNSKQRFSPPARGTYKPG